MEHMYSWTWVSTSRWSWWKMEHILPVVLFHSENLEGQNYVKSLWPKTKAEGLWATLEHVSIIDPDAFDF